MAITYEQRYQETSIELDCPPGSTRPNNLIEGVLKDTGFTVADFDTGNPFFGHQTWVLKETDYEAKAALFKANKPIYKERIESLYHQGVIRYGTW